MIIPTPSLLPESTADYAAQNEILRRLCLGIDTLYATYDSVNKFVLRASAGVVDISRDNTIKLLSIDEDIPLGVYSGDDAYQYVKVEYNDTTGTASFNFVKAGGLSWYYDRCAYWTYTGTGRVLNKRFYKAGSIEQLYKGML